MYPINDTSMMGLMEKIIPNPDDQPDELRKYRQKKRDFGEAIGTDNGKVAALLLEQLTVALPNGMNDPYTLAAIQQLLQDIAPQDMLERLLAVQMIVLHVKSMEQFGASSDSKTIELGEARLKQATCLSDLFGKQLQRLDSHRRKGNQTIQVQHVHINEGGQAMIGNVQQNGKDRGQDGYDGQY